jgi:hypothetical protein
MGIEQSFLSTSGQGFDPQLLAESGAPGFDLARPGEIDRQTSPSVSRRPPCPVLRKAFHEILGDPRVQGAVGAAEDVDEGHALDSSHCKILFV